MLIYNKSLFFCVFVLFFQDPPIVELRFGNRMLDTGRIGPGDDVYFECAARANPSTTIRYSWYHNVSNRSHWCLFELYDSVSFIFWQTKYKRVNNNTYNAFGIEAIKALRFIHSSANFLNSI